MPNSIDYNPQEEQQLEQDTLRVENETLRKGFTLIPNAVLRAHGLSRDAKLLYGILLSYAWQRDSCFPGYDILLQDMQCGRNQLSKYIKELESKGLIEKKRRGQGKTSIYTIKDLPVDTGRGKFQKYQNDTSRSIKAELQEVSKGDLEEYSYKNTQSKNIYPSNIRKAKKDGFDYVNSNGGTKEPSVDAPSTQNEREGHSHNHSRTNGRNIEKIEKNKTIAPAENRTNEPPSVKPQQKSGPSHISQTLQARIPITRADDAEARDAIEGYIRDIAVKLHDEAPLKNSTTRAYNLYARSGVHLGLFFNVLYDAEKEANRRSATIKKLTAQGFKNRMAYFFAIVEDKLGFRENPFTNSHQSAQNARGGPLPMEAIPNTLSRK